MIASAAVLAATLASAQAQFTSITGFGDSYADTGAAPGGAFQLAGIPCIYAPNCTFTGSTTFVRSHNWSSLVGHRSTAAIGRRWCCR